MKIDDEIGWLIFQVECFFSKLKIGHRVSTEWIIGKNSNNSAYQIDIVLKTETLKRSILATENHIESCICALPIAHEGTKQSHDLGVKEGKNE